MLDGEAIAALAAVALAASVTKPRTTASGHSQSGWLRDGRLQMLR
jgi:hypothetical protein